MVENKSSLFGIIALIVGASGLGLGAFSVVNIFVTEGADGLPGQDGQDGIDGTDGLNGTEGQDAPGGLIVGILDPDHDETILGNVTIRALIYGSKNYNVLVLLNTSTVLGTTVPLNWDTSGVSDGWWNLTVIVTDLDSGNSTSDEVIVKVDSYANSGVKRTWYSESETIHGAGTFMRLNITVNPGEVVRFSITGLINSDGAVWIGINDVTSGAPGIYMDPRFYYLGNGLYESISLEGIIDNIIGYGPPGDRALMIGMSLASGSYVTLGYSSPGYPSAFIIQTLIM